MRMRPLFRVGSFVLSLLAAASAEAGPGPKRAEPERASSELRRQGDRVVAPGEAVEISKGNGALEVSSAWRNFHIVQLAAEPLAAYRGGVPGFVAAQVCGATAATLLFHWLVPTLPATAKQLVAKGEV